MLWPGAALLMASVALAAAATPSVPEYITMAEMERYFITRGLSLATALLGGVWLVYGALEKSRDARDSERWANIGKAAEEMTKSVESLAKSLRAHNDENGVHYDVFQAYQQPIIGMLTELKDGQQELRESQAAVSISLARLIAEHDIIRENECDLMRVRNARTRRDDLPGIDAKSLRKPEDK